MRLLKEARQERVNESINTADKLAFPRKVCLIPKQRIARLSERIP